MSRPENPFIITSRQDGTLVVRVRQTRSLVCELSPAEAIDLGRALAAAGKRQQEIREGVR